MVEADADAQRHGPGLFLGRLRARVRQDLRSRAADAGWRRRCSGGLEEGAGAGLAGRHHGNLQQVPEDSQLLRCGLMAAPEEKLFEGRASALDAVGISFG